MAHPQHRFRVSLNLPNRLTLGRLALCVLFVFTLSLEPETFAFSRTTALVIFIIASLTDWLDGEIARRRNLVTDLGKLLDPLADKILISAAFVCLIGDPYGAPMWMVVAIISREFLITGLRIVAAQRGYIMAAEKAGKHKTISQIVVVIVALVLDSSVELHIGDSTFLDLLDEIQPYLLWITLLITVGSGAVYFYRNRSLFSYDEEGDEPELQVPPVLPGVAAVPVLASAVATAPAAAVTAKPAFKEWQAVVAVLGSGRQTLILRKGGIAEGRGGFEVKHERFWLLPTRFHQQGEKLLVEDAASLPVPGAAEDAEVRIDYFAEVVKVAHLTRWEEVEKLEPFHIWKPETIRERFDYKEPGIHAILVRVHRLRLPVTLPWAKGFDGCKSWVELPLDWDGRLADPVLDDGVFAALRARIEAALPLPPV